MFKRSTISQASKSKTTLFSSGTDTYVFVCVAFLKQ